MISLGSKLVRVAGFGLLGFMPLTAFAAPASENPTAKQGEASADDKAGDAPASDAEAPETAAEGDSFFTRIGRFEGPVLEAQSFLLSMPQNILARNPIDVVDIGSALLL